LKRQVGLPSDTSLNFHKWQSRLSFLRSQHRRQLVLCRSREYLQSGTRAGHTGVYSSAWSPSLYTKEINGRWLRGAPSSHKGDCSVHKETTEGGTCPPGSAASWPLAHSVRSARTHDRPPELFPRASAVTETWAYIAFDPILERASGGQS
jgi:hypothetical protein